MRAENDCDCNCLNCDSYCENSKFCCFWGKKLSSDKIDKGCDKWEYYDIGEPGWWCEYAN